MKTKRRHVRKQIESVLIIVEGCKDLEVVKTIFSMLDINASKNNINFLVANGLPNIAKIIEKEKVKYKEVITLVDLDISNNFEAEMVARIKIKSEDTGFHVFTAVPCIESWLFADHDNAKEKSKKTIRTEKLLARLPLPDDIPYPHLLARNVFPDNDYQKIMKDSNLDLAASRSPSLRKFILGVAKVLGVESGLQWEREYVRSAGRDVFSKLVDEVTPPDSVIYKTLEGKVITASEMSLHIKNGTKIGMDYSVDVLRISRDLLARKSNK